MVVQGAFAFLGPGCGGHGGATRDSGADAPATSDAAGDGDAGGTEAAPAPACQRSQDCGSGQFCGAGTRTCLPAVVEVVAGRHHSCARHRDNTVRCWGMAESIRAGGAAVLGPVPVAAAAGARALSASVHLTCAITSGALVRCWGNRDLDVQRDGGAGPQPLGDVSALAIGSIFGCAVNREGTWCWGKNDYGQLARPPSVAESDVAVLSHPGPQRFAAAGIAILVHDGADRLCGWGQNATKLVTNSDTDGVYNIPQCRTAPGVAQLVAGDTHACLLDAAGAFTCWGERYYGALGTGGTDTADVGPPGSPTTLASPTIGLAAGVSHTCALGADGAVRCFGRNHLGQIGPGAAGATEEEIRQPTAVTGFSDRVMTLGGGASAHHTCAILADGSVQCWGANATGQLGDGVRTVDEARFSRTPVTVMF